MNRRPAAPDIGWFITKWRASQLKERSASQEHFLDLCWVLDEPTPADSDKTGDSYCFDRGARKDIGRDGWADVWKRHHFGWEYKGPGRSLKAAFEQLRQYALALENPPLLIVSDMQKFRVRTNWTNSVSTTHEFVLEDLADPDTRNILKWAFSDPERLRPGQTRQGLTEEAASTFASVAQALRDRGHDPATVAHFVNRLVFCMFAEDVGLLPDGMFTRMLEQARNAPDRSADLASKLFGAMASGGLVGFEPVKWFNGGLFNDATSLPMESTDIETVLHAARLDWSDIDPSILGTLFERGLDPDKRSQLGAHYTDREKIARIVEPVVIDPWLQEWAVTKADIALTLDKASAAGSRSARRYHRNRADRMLGEFLDKLRAFTVLDPACGSGNFLYIALHSLKDLEHLVQVEAETLGLNRSFPVIGPSNLKGIEINQYAAELARVAVWIGQIQWMRRNGFRGEDSPVLKPLDNIEQRDAILDDEGAEPDWPEADAVIGNPPFLGGKLLRTGLGDGYVDRMFSAYRDQVPAEADLVCYWVAKTCRLIASGQLRRAGLVTTNSIRGGANRSILEAARENVRIFAARSDEPWVIDGAAVRVSLICLTAADDAASDALLDGEPVSEIFPDLTGRRGSTGFNASDARPLPENRNVAFMGMTKGGKFEITNEQAHEWLRMPGNPHGRPNSDVLRPWMNGKDLTGRPTHRWIIDFGTDMPADRAALYEAPFEWAREHVLPSRRRTRREAYRRYWWRLAESRPRLRKATSGLARVIVTPTTAKYRLFGWCETTVCPDHALIVFARDDYTTFGILHSRFHELWALRMGTSLTDRPRYTPTTTFQTFPFPDGLTPDLPTQTLFDDPRAVAIARAARDLDRKRTRWSNPPEWVRWVDPPVEGFPSYPVPRDEDGAEQLKRRTLTRLYNQRPQWLADAHARLDRAVAAAYGWTDDIAAEEALAALMDLNQTRTGI